ncbi:BrnT family toxin [Candidatus Neomarinimicrobiota bacterium]
MSDETKTENRSDSYEWDPAKSRSNYRKHGVYFADAVFVFGDDFAIDIPDDYPEEERRVIIGRDAFGRILVVVYTWRENNIRIISARKATPTEHKQYEEKR